ncbi:MAG: homing endonuclease associated repeat-containing protein, partial [Armatimonadota bacterium]
EIRRLNEQGEDLRPSAVVRLCQTLLMAAKKYFGGWREAVIAAGIDYDSYIAEKKTGQVEQAKQQIIDEIKRLYQEGRIDELSGAWRYHLSLFRKARHRFGSWKKAIEAAGLNYHEIVQRQKWTPEKIVAEIRRLYAEGKDLSVTAMQRTHPNLVAIAQSPRYFGSWRAAVEAAGLDYELIKRQRGRRRREPIQVRV